MSVRIGDVFDVRSRVIAYVTASTGGVELSHTEANASLTPVAARNYAAVLVRAADEVERMRARPKPSLKRKRGSR